MSPVTSALRLWRVLCLGLSIAALSPTPSRAQAYAGVTVGIFLPMFDPLVKELGGVNGAPVPYPVLEKWHSGGVVFGGRVAWFVTDRFGLETSLAYSPAEVASRDSLNDVTDLSAEAYLLSVRAPIRLTPPAAGLSFFVSPGIGYALRTGPAWRGFGDRGDFNAILAVGGRGQLGRRSNKWFRFEVEDYMSSARFSRGGILLEKQWHHALIYSMGVEIFFGR